MANAQGIGPWEVEGDRAHCNTPFWKLVRRNPAFTGYHYGREILQTPKHRIRRFYDRAKAEKECARLNAAAGVKVCGCLSVAQCHSPGTAQCGNVARGVKEADRG